jgi:hypothetical protein
MDEREENERDARRDDDAFPEPPKPKHALTIGALAPGLVAACSCGLWSTGKMRAGVDYRPMWSAHLSAALLSKGAADE